jgi:hypothetical protein
MVDVHFADIFFILLVCGVIFIILKLVNNSQKQTPVQDKVFDAEKSAGNNDKLAEED